MKTLYFDFKLKKIPRKKKCNKGNHRVRPPKGIGVAGCDHFGRCTGAEK
jgi:hypothetical protein